IADFVDGGHVPFHKLKPQALRFLSSQLSGLLCNLVARIVKGEDPTSLWENLLQDFQTFPSEVPNQEVDACKSPPGFCEALHEPGVDWIAPYIEYDGYVGCRSPRRRDDGVGNCVYERDFVCFKIPRCRLGSLHISLCIPDLEGEVFALFKPQLPQPLSQSVNSLVPRTSRKQNSYAIDLRLLRGARRNGQQDNCEQTEANLSPHRLPRFILPFSFLLLPYLITLSARYSTDWGIIRPICFAILRLMMNSNFVGCSTGKSAGLAPFRILSTYVAARLSKSGKLTPYDISPPASTAARCSYTAGRWLFTASSAISFR